MNKKKLMKGCLITVVAVLLILIVSIIFVINLASKNTKTYDEMDFSKLDLSTIADGTYTGSEDAGIVKASVEVTVENHIITEVKILSHNNGKGKPAEVIVQDIKDQNSLVIDAISGATFSSNVIKMAVYNALNDH